MASYLQGSASGPRGPGAELHHDCRSVKTPLDGLFSRLGARDSPGYRNNGRRNVRRDEHPALDRHTRAHIARRTRQRDTPPARALRLTQTRNGRQPGPHAYLAPRTCLAITLALACLSLAHLSKACRAQNGSPSRHQPARQGINHTSNSPPRSSLHHRRPNIEALIKDAERAAASSNSSSEQQQQQRAAATTANNSSEQKERAAAASSSSEQQQRAAAAVSSSSEQQQQRAARNSSREQQQQQRAAAAIAAAVVNPTYPPVHPYVLSNVYPACISRMYLPYLECEYLVFISHDQPISRPTFQQKKFTKSCLYTAPLVYRTRRLPASTSLNRIQRHHYLPRGDCGTGTTPP